MRYSSIVLFLLCPSLAFADVPFAVRPLDTFTADTLERACRRSALVRAMLGELESSNLVVHIVSSRQLPHEIGGTTRFVTDTGGYRYVRITLSAWLPPSHRVAILGHELHHAVELARSGVTDLPGVHRLFGGAGYYAVRGHEYFETHEALRVEREIRMELRTGQRRPPRQVSLPDK